MFWMTHKCFLVYRKIRRQITLAELRRAARKPWRQLKTKMEDLQVVVLD